MGLRQKAYDKLCEILNQKVKAVLASAYFVYKSDLEARKVTNAITEEEFYSLVRDNLGKEQLTNG